MQSWFGSTFLDRLDYEGDGVRVDGGVAMALDGQQHGLLQERLHELRWQSVSLRHRPQRVGIPGPESVGRGSRIQDAAWNCLVGGQVFSTAESSD